MSAFSHLQAATGNKTNRSPVINDRCASLREFDYGLFSRAAAYKYKTVEDLQQKHKQIQSAVSILQR